MTGLTLSNDMTFPVIDGPDLTHNGGFDAFIARVKESGSALQYCGYIGGAGYDQATGVAVNQERWAHVTGVTSSTEITLSVLKGPLLTFSGGTIDAFITKVKWD